MNEPNGDISKDSPNIRNKVDFTLMMSNGQGIQSSTYLTLEALTAIINQPDKIVAIPTDEPDKTININTRFLVNWIAAKMFQDPNSKLVRPTRGDIGKIHGGH